MSFYRTQTRDSEMWGRTGKGLSLVSKPWRRGPPTGKEETYDEEAGLAKKEEHAGVITSRHEDAMEDVGQENNEEPRIADDQELYLWAGIQAARVTGGGCVSVCVSNSVLICVASRVFSLVGI